MSPKVNTALALLAGFLGGTVSHYWFDPIAARAQSSAVASPTAEIRAQKFVLVDETGAPRGVFGFRSDGSPDLQVKFVKRSGFEKLLGMAEVGSARWLGAERKSMVSDLRSTDQPKPGQPTGSE